MSRIESSDEILLLAYLAEQCNPDEAETLRRRLQQEPQLAKKLRDLQAARDALALVPDVEPPADLTRATMARIRSAQKTDALLAKEELRRRGLGRPTFCLREALTAAAAVLLLALVFLPSIRSANQREMQNLCASQTGQIGHAIRNYSFDHDGRMPAPPRRLARWLPNGNEEYVSNSSGLFRLVLDEYADARIFQCPARHRESFQVRRDMRDFPAGKFIHYAYQHVLDDAAPQFYDPRLDDAVEEMVILADDNPIFEQGRFHKDRLHAQASANHGGRGQNVLYMPGNVRWVESPDVGVDGNNIYQATNVYEYTGTERPAGPNDSFLLPAYSRR